MAETSIFRITYECPIHVCVCAYQRGGMCSQNNRGMNIRTPATEPQMLLKMSLASAPVAAVLLRLYQTFVRRAGHPARGPPCRPVEF